MPITTLQTTSTIEDQRSNYTSPQSLIQGIDSDNLNNLPVRQWQEQFERYLEYWSWYTGEKLNEVRGVSDTGEVIYKFPLKMNEVRNFALKHASIVLGEAPDGPNPMIKTIIVPKRPLDSAKAQSTEKDKKLATLAQNIVNEVWLESKGRSLQIENAILQQFLGGCVFKVCWHPEREDLRIPVVLEKIIPDFFFPVWNPNDPFDLLEAWVIYKIPASAANLQYGTKATGQDALFVEYWSKTKYSIFVNNEPITITRGDVSITLNNVEHDWGFVPYVYIPAIREGSFYGHSIVEYIRGLVMEYNARMADQGDAIRTTVHRRRYARNISMTVKERLLGKNTWVIDLGQEQFNAKHPPEVWSEDPPKMESSLTGFTKDLWLQLLREGGLQNIAFGEDEGSQRSALTLAFRMWPTTARGRMTRSFWHEGMSVIAKMILKIVSLNKLTIGVEIPSDFAKLLAISCDFAPMVPRDREQDVNENVLLKQAGMRSLSLALDNLGDVRDKDEEIRNIHSDQEFQADLQKKAQPPVPQKQPGQSAPEPKANVSSK